MTGTGKNYLSQIIAQAMYVNGINSQYVHIFVSTVHFPDPKKIRIYQVGSNYFKYYDYF